MKKIVDGRVNTEENTASSPDLGHAEDEYTLPEKTAGRLLSVIGSPAWLIKIGPPLPLLAVLIMRCDNEKNESIINLHEQAATLGVSHGTLKGWLRQLRELGLVTSEPAGAGGVRIRLIPEALPSGYPIKHETGTQHQDGDINIHLRICLENGHDGHAPKVIELRGAA